MSHARCEHGTIADLCPDCWPELRKVVPFPTPNKTAVVKAYAAKHGIPVIDLSDPATSDAEIDRMASILGISPEVVAAVPPMPFVDPLRTLSEALATAFVESRYAMLQKAFEAHPPLLVAALTVTILDYLPPDEKDNFSAFVRRMARDFVNRLERE